MQNILETVKQNESVFWGESPFRVIFLISLLLIILLEKKDSNKRMIVWYTALVYLFLVSPIFIIAGEYVWGMGGAAYYCRQYTLLPVFIAIAYGFTLLITNEKPYKKISALIIIILIISLSGTNFYKLDWVSKAENKYKMPDDVLEICHIISERRKEDASVSFVEGLDGVSRYIRQYDASIHYNSTFDSSEEPYALMSKCGEEGSDFLILPNNEILILYIQSGFAPIYQSSRYALLEVSGVPRCKKYYSKDEQVSRIEYLNANDKLERNSDGYMAVEYKYNKKHQLVAEKYYDNKNNLTLCNDGYAGILYEYDNDGSEWKCYIDKKQRPTINAFGYAYEKQESLKDNMKMISYYDKGKNLAVADKFGYASIENYYNEKNWVEKSLYYDTKGNLTLCDGIAGIIYEYDDVGFTVKQTFLGTDGRIFTRDKGYAALSIDYNGMHKIKSEHFLDITGKRTDCIYGYAGIAYDYNEDGKVHKTTYLDINDMPVNSVNEYAVVEFIYDNEGNVSYKCYDSEGELVEN